MKAKTTVEKSDSVETIEMEIISEESEDEDDEEDEVFVRAGKHENGAAKKPLIKSRMKNGKKSVDNDTEIREGKPTAKRCCGPICCIFLGLKSLVGVVALSIVLTNYLTHSSWLFWHFQSDKESANYAGCDNLEIVPVWQAKFPMFIVEGSTRMLQVNDDNVLDVVFGFGTGADGYDIPDFVCDIYFNGQKPCLGGVVAVDGKTGVEIWRLWTKHEIFALTCQADIDDDGLTDCLAGGRAGVFLAISIKEGKELWSFGDHAIVSDLMSVYAAQFIQDVDNDGVEDVLAVHGGDALADPNPQEHMFGRLILFSGKTGRLLQWMPTPDSRESYYPPQVTTSPDGRQIIIFGTGSNKHGGGLYAKALLDLYRKNITNVKMIYKDEEQGILNPAALVDINKDGILDIVMASMNSKVLAFDGMTFSCIWNVSVFGHQSSSSVAVGLYDDDDIPDIIVKYNYGENFPIYEYEKTVILSGKNGSILSDTMINSLPSQSTPISISMKGNGNDIFLHWTINCLGYKGDKLKYGFRESAHLYEKSQADLCRALYGVPQDVQFQAVSRKFPNGIAVYNSTDWQEYEHVGMVNTSALAAKYLIKHPEIQDNANRGEDMDPYSVLPYKKKDFENYIKLLQAENEREYSGQRPIIDPGTLSYSDLLENDYDLENISDESNVPIGIPVFRESDKLVQPQQEQQQINEFQAQSPDLYPQFPMGYPQQQGQFPRQYPQQGPQYPGSYLPKQKRSGKLNESFLERARRAADLHLAVQGIHKQSATGTLAPPLIPANDTIDLIISTYWVYPPKLDILRPEDLRCIEKELKLHEKKSNINNASEDFAKDIETMEKNCLDKTGHYADENLTYETPSDYDPLSVNMGQMMVYRFSLRCMCDESKLESGQQCGKMMPYASQGWPAYMGLRGDSKYRRHQR